MGHGLQPIHVLEPVCVDFLYHSGLEVWGHLAHQLPGPLGALQLVPLLEILFHAERKQWIDVLQSDDPVDVIHTLPESTVLRNNFLCNRHGGGHHHCPDDPAQHHQSGCGRDLHLIPMIWGDITVPNTSNGKHGKIHRHQIHLTSPDVPGPRAVPEVVYKPRPPVSARRHGHETQVRPVARKDVTSHNHQHCSAQGRAHDVGHVELGACQAKHGLHAC
mmetsp:Transcript_72842/g.194429  ORF Transcript_72842/g.194429 Transcript_72842/m.194429 type:complete len:218 (+) Transcript_72842:943-1596(+)